MLFEDDIFSSKYTGLVIQSVVIVTIGVKFSVELGIILAALAILRSVIQDLKDSDIV